LFFILFSGAAIAQRVEETLTLEKCLNIALERNFELKRVQNQALIAASNENQARMNFLPSVNAGISYDMVRGSNFDQTNAILTNTTTSSSPYVAAEVPLFNGLENHYLIQRNKIIKEAALDNIESVKDLTMVEVTGLYLQILIDMADIEIIKTRIDLLNEQLGRARKRTEAGVANMQQVYNLNSQIANENLNLVRAQNRLESDRLALFQSLQLDDGVEYAIAPVEIHEDEISAIGSYDDILASARAYSPGIKASEKMLESEKKNLQISRAARLPRLSLTASLSSHYSSNDAEHDYLNQIRQRMRRDVGLRLSIPLFNQFRVKNAIQTAEIGVSDAELSLRQANMNLTNQVQQAYLDLTASQSAYFAAKENLNALAQAFQFAETSYNSGNSDFYSYLESLNNKNRAELDLEISKYSFVLRKRILDILAGQK